MALEFYIPVLKSTTTYKRLSGFFSANSMVVIAAGLRGLIGNGGKMRLVLGAHDIDPELREAHRLSEEEGERIVEEIGRRIADDLDQVEDLVEKRRLEFLAWMLKEGMLEVRVALPKKTFLHLASGIFHKKVLVFEDDDGCKVVGSGSANETRAAYEANGEQLDIFRNWEPGQAMYVERYERTFKAIWERTHPDYLTFSLPEALKKRIQERFYSGELAGEDPVKDPSLYPRLLGPQVDQEKCVSLLVAARLVEYLGRIRGLVHLGLGPVRLHPHQTFAVDFVLSRFPHRMLLADEVGLGKTIEAGAIVKRLVSMERADRVLILAPKNVTRQWLEELHDHFGMRFWLLESAPRRFVDAKDNEISLGSNENPFDHPGVDYIIASWHYARGSRRRPPEVLQASQPFDLVVIDEAHNARKKRYPGKTEPTLLHDLCLELGITSPHILLVTATPVQLRPEEAMDLLRILGLGGNWVHEGAFSTYIDILGRPPGQVKPGEWAAPLRLAGEFARRYLTREEVGELVRGIFKDVERAAEIEAALQDDAFLMRFAKSIQSGERQELRRLLVALNPMQWFMVRNTRERMEEFGYRFPEREVAEVSVGMGAVHSALLRDLDSYVSNEYAAYERLLSSENRGVVGFVRSIYHQRFVSSFSAAYCTVRNRRKFLQALLEGDEDALLRLAGKFLEDEYLDVEEEDLVDIMQDLLEQAGAERLVRKELERVKELESRLRPYDPQTPSGRDPKLGQVLDTVEELLSQGRRVLLFSKYKDTVAALVKYLDTFATRVTRREIGIYTGAGGAVFDEAKGERVAISKREVVESLDEGSVRVLVCTDAASEGLNLQAASAVVNVDMPWNPSKVEQRIGRVDRLGQDPERPVLVRNVWYPDSIEAEMYRALFDRREIYQLVVGPAQDIVSVAMRRALDEGRRGERLRELVKETLQQVEAVKDKVVATAGALSGASWKGRKGTDEDVVDRLADFAVQAGEALGFEIVVEEGRLIVRNEDALPEDIRGWNRPFLDVGRPNALTAAHPIILWLAGRIQDEAEAEEAPPADRSIYLIGDHEGLFEVDVVFPDEARERLEGSRVVNLLESMYIHSGEGSGS